MEPIKYVFIFNIVFSLLNAGASFRAGNLDGVAGWTCSVLGWFVAVIS